MEVGRVLVMRDRATAPDTAFDRPDANITDRLRTMVPTARPTDPSAATVISNYSLPGVDWDYYRVFYRILGLGHHWPDGLTAHAAWEGKSAWRSFFLWNDKFTADAYFARVGIDTVTKTVRAMGVAKGPSGVTDVVPWRLAIHDLYLGPSTRAFAGVGEDKDGSSIDALGARPVICELQLNSRAKPVASALGLKRLAPADLLGQIVSEADDACQLLQIWSDAEIARAALQTLTIPALREAGIECAEDPFESIFELRLLLLAGDTSAAAGNPPA